MKIYIDSSVLKNRYNKIKDNFKDIIITDKVEDSYDADGIMVYPKDVIKENIDKYPNLSWIQVFTAGYNTIDLEYLKSRNIVLCNGKDIYSIPIAEDVIAKILAFNRNIPKYLEAMKTKTWGWLNSEYELTNSTVGIVGVGSIGKEIAKRLKAFNVNIIGYRRQDKNEEFFDKIYFGNDGLNELLKLSDYVILALPLTDESYHMINLNKIRIMKKSALLINIARGEVVKQDDLIYALENHYIRGAALDVVYPEPLPQDSALWTLDNVYLSPHNSFSSPYTMDRLMEFLINNLDNYINHKNLLNIVNLGGK
ncbi:MAG: D-2-hydroxyacid dehydrogenase [Bacilli bacterium]